MFLVLVGGIVRTTGSGMGCPDWPKCFGSWIPPTSVDQVPVSYYSNPLSSKDGVLVFNVYKTWTEYVNRLIGVFIGLALMLQLFWAFRSGSPSRS
ncbi:MAG TPA: COX15/CtaA family protein, partial [Catalimonadaceae bacterium]|nr:COX15/CtaA family protein [Catalimonadaceae bacterium]